MNKQIKFVFLAILIFLPLTHLNAHGFCAGTKVKTTLGQSNIENLSIGTTVLSCQTDQEYSEQPIIAVRKIKAPSFIRLWFKDQHLDTSPDQLFYLAQEKKWLPAKNLTKEHILLKNCVEELTIDDIETIAQETEFYIITVKEHHNFCVTQHNILVHNIVPAVVLGFSVAFGGGSVEFIGASIGVGVLGAILGFKICKEKSKPKPELKIDSAPGQSNKPTTPTINQKTSINKPNPPKLGCGNMQIPKPEDHILITPILQPDRQPNKGCFQPVPPLIKPGCGDIQQPKIENFIHKQETQTDEQKVSPSVENINSDKEIPTKTKTPEEIIKESKPGKETSGKTKQYEKPGDFNTALQDFYGLGLSLIKDISIGKMGILPDGRKVIVRTRSKDSRPTLEIQNPKNGRKIKIRYGDK